jgi:zinc transporter, ZIP family
MSEVLLNLRYIAAATAAGLVGGATSVFWAPGRWVTSYIQHFGAAALLYLVTEELLVETQLPEETLVSTAMFFLGFVAIFALVLAG